MKNLNKHSAALITLLSIVTIIITAILVFALGHKKFTDELFITISIISLFLFLFLFYGFYNGVYLKNDIDYKTKIKSGNSYIKEGIKNIFDSFSYDFSFGVDIPILNIFFAIIGFVLFLIFISIFLYGASLFLFGIITVFPFIIYWLFYKLYRTALKFSNKTQNNFIKSFIYSIIFTFIYSGWLLGVLLFSKYFLLIVNANIA